MICGNTKEKRREQKVIFLHLVKKEHSLLMNKQSITHGTS